MEVEQTEQVTTIVYTANEAFNRARSHLLDQKRKSLVTRIQLDEMNTICAYRGNAGEKCAIGALIPDEYYSPAFEGHRAAGLLRGLSVDDKGLHKLRLSIRPNSPNAPPIEGEVLHFVRDLQEVHDRYEPEQWEHQLDEVYQQYANIIDG